MKNERMAELGVELLEEAILAVLLEARSSGESPLNAGDISRRLNIPFNHEKGSASPYYYIALGILHFLVSKGTVERPEGKQTWQITEQEMARRTTQ